MNFAFVRRRHICACCLTYWMPALRCGHSGARLFTALHARMGGSDFCLMLIGKLSPSKTGAMLGIWPATLSALCGRDLLSCFLAENDILAFPLFPDNSLRLFGVAETRNPFASICDICERNPAPTIAIYSLNFYEVR